MYKSADGENIVDIYTSGTEKSPNTDKTARESGSDMIILRRISLKISLF